MTQSEAEKNSKRTEADQKSRAAQEILDALDRWSQRIGNHYTQKRANTRRPYRELITIYIPEYESAVGEADDQVAIQAWTRNISRSGVTFIHPEPIAVNNIVLCFNPPGRKCIYLDAEIVRRRQVQNGFWEYGARYNGRANM
jgi:PilZ domain